MSAGTQQIPLPWTPAAPQLVMAYSVCKGITRTAAKNFYYAFLVLPRRKREALCAVYAFIFAFGTFYIYRLIRTGPAGKLFETPRLAVPNRPMSLANAGSIHEHSPVGAGE